MQTEPLPLKSITYDAAADAVEIIDQTLLPHQLSHVRLQSLEHACHAIQAMQVRGAPLIGITAAFGMYFALRDGIALGQASSMLAATRPTAVNLRWALRRLELAVDGVAQGADTAARALCEALQLQAEDVAACSAIGDHGLVLLESLWRKKRERDPTATRLNILTHCNTGWLATAEWGTALAPIYKAHAHGIPLHVWVDETRPRSQGASLTTWELGARSVPHSLIVDNAGGHLMQQGEVDVCLVGSDRTAANGDVCNKIGTYLKALAAVDNDLPFYVALPVSTIDFELPAGVGQIPIENRSADEIHRVVGIDEEGLLRRVRISPVGCQADNPGFDVTPARLISGLITERGVHEASAAGVAALHPDGSGNGKG